MSPIIVRVENGRVRWTPTIDDYLLDQWPDQNATQLGAALGVPPGRVRARLQLLRRQRHVPFGQTGRPPK